MFQVYVKQNIVADHPTDSLKFGTNDFTFTTKKEAHFAVRRVGAHAGKVIQDFTPYAATSNYFIKVSNTLQQDEVMWRLRSLNWTHEKQNNAGVPSISKPELIKKYLQMVSKEATPPPVSSEEHQRGFQ